MEIAVEVKIPKERIAVLIGAKGETKKQIEIRTKTKISVSKEGDVIIKGDDGFACMLGSQMVKAIGRGFSPDKAEMLSDERYFMTIINLKQFGGSDESLQRLRSRIIGTDGKARRVMEDLSNTFISVYGKTVSILGETENVINAKKGIEMILQGAKHSTAYHYLEKLNRKKRATGIL